jgi:hypothetical protein
LDHQVRAPPGDLVGVAGLGVQGVGDEQYPGQRAEDPLDGVEQRSERGDLIALGVDGDLGQDDAGAGVQRGQKVDLAAVGPASTPQRFAVDGDHGAMP